MTATLTQLKGRFYQFLGTYRALVATGGSTSKFTVASLADVESNRYQGWQLRVLTGASAGDLRVLGAGPNAAGDLEPKRAFSSTGPTSTDTAELWGNSIEGGDELTTLFNSILGVARPYVPTKLTIVTGQSIYDLTAYARGPLDVRRVSIRPLDPAGVILHPDRWLTGPIVYRQVNAVTGAVEIMMDLGQTMTANTPATQELWVHGYKTLPAFVTDTSTVAAEYADWLAWEAVLRHANAMNSQTKNDKGAWASVATLAATNTQNYREVFAPYVPLFINPFGASA